MGLTVRGKCRACHQEKDRRRYHADPQRKIAVVNAYRATPRGQLTVARYHLREDINRRLTLIAGYERELQ